jgi:D-amino-acid oxidase
VADPWWRDALPGFRRATPSELPAGYADGYAFAAPVIEMPIYLAYLQARFANLGGQVEARAVATIDEALAASDLVIDCAGLGARELVGDASLFAIRGQVVRVKQVGIERFWLDDYGPRGLAYIVPRSNDIILGGTAQEGDEQLEPDPATAAAIFERCAWLEPRLRDAAILEHKVGLRPGRPAVRLEAEQHSSGKRLIHNYGHGGAGVTLSWGCADEVVRLARA